MSIKVTYVIISVCFLILINCSCRNKIDTEISVLSTFKEVSPVAATPYSKPNAIAKTEALVQNIKGKPTYTEQLKSAFYELDNRNPLIDNEFDSEGFLLFTMDLFKEFLSTEQALNMTAPEYMSLSPGIKIFNIKNSRLFSYCGSALLFGDTGRTNFAYLQVKVDEKIKVSTLYYDFPNDILDVIQPAENQNMIIVTGSDRTQQGRRAFIHGFLIKNGIVNKIDVLKDYDDGFWCVDTGNGTVFIKDSFITGTYINIKPGKTIQVEAQKANLTLIYDSMLQKYSVKNATK